MAFIERAGRRMHCRIDARLALGRCRGVSFMRHGDAATPSGRRPRSGARVRDAQLVELDAADISNVEAANGFDEAWTGFPRDEHGRS